MSDQYSSGTVRALLKTDQVTDRTRQVLTERLNTPPRQPTFFTPDEFVLLQAICDRLVPQNEDQERIDIAGGIDKRLSENKSDGWRYDIMPNDVDAYRLGLQGIAEASQIMFQKNFQNISAEQQDSILKTVQAKTVPGNAWQQLAADRFFEELLTEAVENYYSHPLAQEEIGYVGMADVPTWQRIDLNQLEAREPKSIG